MNIVNTAKAVIGSSGQRPFLPKSVILRVYATDKSSEPGGHGTNNADPGPASVLH